MLVGIDHEFAAEPERACGSPRQSKDPIRVDIPPCIRHGLWFRNFLDGVVRTTRRARIRWGGEARDDTFGHEPAFVTRCCNPAKLLLGFPKFVSIPRCNDHRRCHPCCWHSQGGPAAMAPSRTSEQLRRVGIATTRRQNGQALISRAVGLEDGLTPNPIQNSPSRSLTQKGFSL